MAIQRFNPEGLHATPGYHHVTVVDAGRTVYLAGQCPLDADGNVVGATNDQAGLAAQVDQVAANALVALTAAGVVPNDVVRSVIYVVSDDGDTLGEVWKRFTETGRWHLRSPRPARCSVFPSWASVTSASSLISRPRCIEDDLPRVRVPRPVSRGRSIRYRRYRLLWKRLVVSGSGSEQLGRGRRGSRRALRAEPVSVSGGAGRENRRNRSRSDNAAAAGCGGGRDDAERDDVATRRSLR